MGAKVDNLGINSGLLLPSFILNYMVIRVKEKEFEEGKIERTDKERENDWEKRETKRKAKILRISLLDHNSSVEVGYDFYAFHSKLLIANDMYW